MVIKMKYKILVIDDDSTREDIFYKFFSRIEKGYEEAPEFKLEFIKTPNNLEKDIKDSKADAILLDAILQDDQNPCWREKIKIETVLDKIKSAFNIVPPIFLVSSKWNENLLKDVNDAFAKSIPNTLPKKYYTYKQFTNIVRDISIKDDTNMEVDYSILIEERKKIHDIIAQHYGRTNKSLFKKNQINILHLSDLQYGDSKTTNNTVGLFRSIKNALGNNGIENIDLIVVSGDIAMSGKESEYKLAENLTTLINLLWGNEKNNGERIILAPGNHDFDINYCTLNYFNAKNLNGTRQIDLLSLIKELLNKDNINHSSYNKEGIRAFQNYCYKITQNPIYISNSNMNFVIENFLDWGIRFIILDSISNVNINETNHVEFNKNEINKLVDNISESQCDNNIFNIVVSHHTEMFFEKGDEQIAVLDQLKNSLNCKLFLGGHRHISANKESETSDDKKYIVIEAASLRVDDESDEYVRGFNVIQLNRTNEQINSIIEKQFIFNKIDGAPKLERTDEHRL